MAGVVCAFTGDEGDHDQGQKTEGTARHVGVRTLEGLPEGFGDTSQQLRTRLLLHEGHPCKSSAELY